MSLNELRRKILNQPKVRAFIKKRDPAFIVSQTVHEARFRRGLTQVELAKKMKTTQSSIARVESGRILPSLTFLDNMARALKTHLIVKFAFMADYEPLPTINDVTDGMLIGNKIKDGNSATVETVGWPTPVNRESVPATSFSSDSRDIGNDKV